MTTLAASPWRRLPLERLSAWGAVPLSLAVAGLVLGRNDPTSIVWIVTAFFGAVVVWIVAQDLKTLTISDGANLSLAIVALAYRSSMSIDWRETALTTSADLLLTGGLLLVFREVYYRRRGFDGIGLGDVKLAAGGGLLVGAVGFSWALLAASALALGFIGLTRLLRIGRTSEEMDRVAFGAVLAPALWMVWLVQQFLSLPIDLAG